MSETTEKHSISIDVDNTLADYTEGLRSWMSENIDSALLGPMPEPDFYDFEFASGWIFPENKFAPVHERAVADGLYLNLPPIKGAVETVNRLKEHGWSVTIVTGRAERDALNQTAEWLKRQGIRYDRLTGDKNVMADVYIDDDPSALTRHAFLRPDTITVAFDHKYNKQWPGLRLVSWDNGVPTPEDYPEYMRRANRCAMSGVA